MWYTVNLDILQNIFKNLFVSIFEQKLNCFKFYPELEKLYHKQKGIRKLKHHIKYPILNKRKIFLAVKWEDTILFYEHFEKIIFTFPRTFSSFPSDPFSRAALVLDCIRLSAEIWHALHGSYILAHLNRLRLRVPAQQIRSEE